MERLFVYRTVPQLKFSSSRFNGNKIKKQIKQSFSQKHIKTEGNEQVLFKTKKNILLKSYEREDFDRLNNKSFFISKKMQDDKQKISKKMMSRVNTEIKQCKFHEINLNNLAWQKWKKPFDIVKANKQIRNLPQRTMIIKSQRKLTSIQKDVYIINNVMKRKTLQREYNNLERFKKSVQNKKEVISLMQKIDFAQNYSIERVIQGYKKEAVEMCQQYKNKKFDDFNFRKRMGIK